MRKSSRYLLVRDWRCLPGRVGLVGTHGEMRQGAYGHKLFLGFPKETIMSRGTRQEVLIRSLIEALCLTLKTKLAGQPRQKPKVAAIGAIMDTIEGLSHYCPIDLEPREAQRVVAILDWFQQMQEADPDLQIPEVLIAMALGLADRLANVYIFGMKSGLVAVLNQQVQGLYDTFDRQVKKLDRLSKGAALADLILSKEI